MNPKDDFELFASTKQKKFILSDTESDKSDESDYFMEGDDENEQIEDFFLQPQEEIKNFVETILETSFFDTTYLSHFSSRHDWFYLKNKLNDPTLKIQLSNPLEFWDCIEHFLNLFNDLSEKKKDEEYDNDDDFLIYFQNISAIKNYLLILLKKFINQMPESVISKVIQLFNMYPLNDPIISSLFLKILTIDNISSSLLLPIAFKLEGKNFLKAFIKIHENFPLIALNSISFFKRIVEIQDFLVFKALDCGAFSDEELIEYGVIDFCFFVIDSHQNDENISQTMKEKQENEKIIQKTLFFIAKISQRTDIGSQIYQKLLEIGQNGSINIKISIIKVFDAFIEDLDSEIIGELLENGILEVIFEVIQTNLNESELFTGLKMINGFLGFSMKNGIDFKEIINKENDIEEIKENLQSLENEENKDLISIIFQALESE